MQPHMTKELPPEVPRLYRLSLSYDFRHNRKYLFPCDRSLNHTLRITHDIIPIRLHMVNPVHDILSVSSFKEHHIALLQFCLRLPKEDRITLMNQKWRHTIPCNPHADFPSIIRQLLQNRHIFSCIYHLHISVP